MIFDVITRGYHVILAHPERCGQLLAEPVLFEKILQTGCLIQVNMGSLLGYNGSQIVNLVKEITHQGYVHCLATDSHDTKYRNATLMAEGVDLLRSWVDETRANILVKTNPQRVLQSRDLETFHLGPLGQKRKGIKRFFSWVRS